MPPPALEATSSKTQKTTIRFPAPSDAARSEPSDPQDRSVLAERKPKVADATAGD
jgi:hypothetical protein